MRHEEIYGKKVVFAFTILIEGWELDSEGWVVEGGDMYTTNHGGLCRLGKEELQHHIDITQDALNGLVKARDYNKEA